MYSAQQIFESFNNITVARLALPCLRLVVPPRRTPLTHLNCSLFVFRQRLGHLKMLS
ncbi:unnamed protein product [Rhodiola kirilowii]